MATNKPEAVSNRTGTVILIVFILALDMLNFYGRPNKSLEQTLQRIEQRLEKPCQQTK